MTDQEIVALLQNSASRSQGLRQVYALYTPIAQWLSQQGAGEEDAKDIFQEGVIVLYRKAQQPSFSLTSKLSTFLHGICRNLWLKHCRDERGKGLADESMPDLFEPSSDGEYQHAQKQAALKAVASLGEPCEPLLKAYYFEQQSMTDIAQQMGYKSEKVARNQKYKCLERVKKLAKSFVQTLLFTPQKSAS